MYLLAICDDETEELNKIEQMLKDYQTRLADGAGSISVRKFKNAQVLFRVMKEEGYRPDILLLDIYMPEKRGTEAARELREMGNTCRIIFLTTSREHALDAFQVGAVQYLLKPVSGQKLFPVLDKILAELQSEQSKYLLLHVEDSIRKIAAGDIVYCEAQRKKQCIYLQNGECILLRLTMTKLNEMLSAYREFTKVGISYIVNLEHIEGLNARAVQMDNGREIYLPRGSYKALREIYFNYYFGGVQ